MLLVIPLSSREKVSHHFKGLQVLFAQVSLLHPLLLLLLLLVHVQWVPLQYTPGRQVTTRPRTPRSERPIQAVLSDDCGALHVVIQVG